jgi:hypothetical protein
LRIYLVVIVVNNQEAVAVHVCRAGVFVGVEVYDAQEPPLL